jgi:hypothetical protein
MAAEVVQIGQIEPVPATVGQAAAAGSLAWCAQAAQRLAQVIGCAQDEGLEGVDRGGAGVRCLAPGGQQDPQRLAGTVDAWLGELGGGERVAGSPGRIRRGPGLPPGRLLARGGRPASITAWPWACR